MVKRPRGVLIFSWLIIITGILGIFWNLKALPFRVDAGLRSFAVLCATLSAISVIYGVGLIMLKESTRKLALVANIVILVLYPSLLVFWKMPTLPFAVILRLGFATTVVYFFTRPGVRSQFK